MDSMQREERLLVAALEGASNYWIEGIQTHAPHGVEFYPGILQHGMTVWVLRESDDAPQDVREVSAADFAGALRALSDTCPDRYADIMAEEDDAYAADCWLQMAVFGDVIFG